MDTVASEVKEVRVSAAAAGDNIALAALGPGKKIRVTGGFLIAASAVDMIIKSDVNALSGARTLAAKARELLDIVTCNENQQLVLNLSSAVAIVGIIEYVVVEVI